MKNLVSIVMGTYEGEKFLKSQIESILNQTYSNFELIVVDDASTDGTLSILQDYAKRDNRIQVHISEKNIGFVANFERGLMLAKGEFIALSDQDDIFCNDKIEKLVNRLEVSPKRDLVVSDLSLIDSDGNQFHESFWQNQKLNPSSGKPFRRLIYSNFATGCAMMFRRRLLDIALPFPKGILVHDWWITIVATTKNAGGVCLLDQTLTAYRQHGANVIGAKPVYVLKVPTLEKFMRFIKSPSQIDFSKTKARLRTSAVHSARVRSYLQRDIWTESEMKVIEQTIKVFESYALDDYRSLSKRLLIMPLRLRYAILTKRLTSVIAVLLITFFPNIRKHK